MEKESIPLACPMKLTDHQQKQLLAFIFPGDRLSKFYSELAATSARIKAITDQDREPVAEVIDKTLADLSDESAADLSGVGSDVFVLASQMGQGLGYVGSFTCPDNGGVEHVFTTRGLLWAGHPFVEVVLLAEAAGLDFFHSAPPKDRRGFYDRRGEHTVEPALLEMIRKVPLPRGIGAWSQGTWVGGTPQEIVRSEPTFPTQSAAFSFHQSGLEPNLTTRKGSSWLHGSDITTANLQIGFRPRLSLFDGAGPLRPNDRYAFHLNMAEVGPNDAQLGRTGAPPDGVVLSERSFAPPKWSGER